MGAFFAKPAKPAARKPTPQQENEMTIRRTRMRLTELAKRSEAEADDLTRRAKVLARAKKTTEAKRLLALRHLKQKSVKVAWAGVMRLEQSLDAIATAEEQKAFLAGLRAGTDGLEQAQADLRIDDIEALMDRTDEAMEQQEEIDAVIRARLDPDGEEEVDASLEAILREHGMLDDEPAAEAAAAPPLPGLPDVPAALPEVPSDLPAVPSAEPARRAEAVPA